ncbi:cytochrome b5 domain-containing protein [Nesterenkonia halotolerans]|uniref:cytochrome b5 domain-containing protein n=1 Tax=Nesterenkonia halotolerans TaxID=225325 RepID=UPI003EE69A0F
MTTAIQAAHWKRTLLFPVAAIGVLLLSACGADDDQGEDSPGASGVETEEAQTEDADTGTGDAATQETAPEGAGAAEAFTMDQVEENDSAESCWAVMSGTVYDLSDWIEDHPGGPERIEGLCGTDASAAFEGQHGGQAGPEDQLAEFEIGTLED